VRVCTICQAPRRPAIEAALAPRTPLRKIAAEFRTTPSTLMRHRDHALRAFAAVGKPRKGRAALKEIVLGKDLLDDINALLDKAQQFLTRKP
jgi:hypothetical protein